MPSSEFLCTKDGHFEYSMMSLYEQPGGDGWALARKKNGWVNLEALEA